MSFVFFIAITYFILWHVFFFIFISKFLLSGEHLAVALRVGASRVKTPEMLGPFQFQQTGCEENGDGLTRFVWFFLVLIVKHDEVNIVMVNMMFVIPRRSRSFHMHEGFWTWTYLDASP